MSIHTTKAFNKALSLGAWAGQDFRTWAEFAALSKRELVEAVLRLAASAAGECDDRDAGVERAREEIATLRLNKII